MTTKIPSINKKSLRREPRSYYSKEAYIKTEERPRWVYCPRSLPCKVEDGGWREEREGDGGWSGGGEQTQYEGKSEEEGYRWHMFIYFVYGLCIKIDSVLTSYVSPARAQRSISGRMKGRPRCPVIIHFLRQAFVMRPHKFKEEMGV